MTARSLDFRVMKNGRKYDEFKITADPVDTPVLQAKLKDWLEGGKWDKKLWSLFHAEVLDGGKIRVVRL